MYTIPHCTQVNLHNNKTPKTIKNWTWCDKKEKRLLEEKHLNPGTPGVVGEDTFEDGTNH